VIYPALSIKQPWATLLAHGLKTIEVRRWQTRFRGTLLIHAANIPDDRSGAWEQVPEELLESAQQMRGVIGVGRLDSCKLYRTLAGFIDDQPRHLNDPAWFEETGLFGLCFTELRQVSFRSCPGNLRIFKIDLEDLEIPPPPPVVVDKPEGERPSLEELMARYRRPSRPLGQPLAGAPDGAKE
jgi:hypothetical protein